MFDTLTDQERSTLGDMLKDGYDASKAYSRSISQLAREFTHTGYFPRHIHQILFSQAAMRAELTSLTWQVLREYSC